MKNNLKFLIEQLVKEYIHSLDQNSYFRIESIVPAPDAKFIEYCGGYFAGALLHKASMYSPEEYEEVSYQITGPNKMKAKMYLESQVNEQVVDMTKEAIEQAAKDAIFSSLDNGESYIPDLLDIDKEDVNFSIRPISTFNPETDIIIDSIKIEPHDNIVFIEFSILTDKLECDATPGYYWSSLNNRNNDEDY